MKLINLQDVDYLNYSKPSMFIGFPYCSGKCGWHVCQNEPLLRARRVEVTADELVERFLANPLSKAIVCGGLEPMDSFDDIIELLTALREKSQADFVIYTGFAEEEIPEKTVLLKNFSNVIIKYGRYVASGEKHLDPILGVVLASKNQYAVKIS